MRITRRTPLVDVVAALAAALEAAGIETVLTGGSCATLHSGGAYQSLDIDFVLRTRGPIAPLDAAMATVGYTRDGRRYVHPVSPFTVEFLPGPVAVGGDLDVRPVLARVGEARVRALSPTDSVRDRLAAWYHWNDRSSLAVAVAIAARHRVSLARIRRWSEGEDAVQQFEEFRRLLTAARRGRRTRI